MTIGLSSTEVITTERNGSAEVCVRVLDGRLGRNFTFLFETLEGENLDFIFILVVLL